MCVWKRYEKLDKLEIGIKDGRVYTANGDVLKKDHEFGEFMDMAEEHYWQPEPEPDAKDTTITLCKKTGK